MFRWLFLCASILGVIAIAWIGATNLDYRWQWKRIVRYFIVQQDDGFSAGVIIEALGTTGVITFFSTLLALVLGFGIYLMNTSRLMSLHHLAQGYLMFIRCTPLLVQLYLFYFILSNALPISRMASGIIAIGLYEAAFAAEIYRAGIESVRKSQHETSLSLGLSTYQSLLLVIVPQTLPLILPALGNLFVAIFKHSSIVTVIGIDDLANTTRNLISDTFLVFELWLVVAAIYIAIAIIATQFLLRWERRLKMQYSTAQR